MTRAEMVTEEEAKLLRFYRSLDQEGRLVVLGCAIVEKQRTDREETRARRLRTGAACERKPLHIVR